MSNADAIHRVREQCLEMVFDIVPSRQIFFILLFVTVADGLLSKKATSPVAALMAIDLKALLTWEGEGLWVIPISTWILAIALAIMNEALIRVLVCKAFASPKIELHCGLWLEKCSRALKEIDDTARQGVVSSLKEELQGRLKNYRAQRAVSELCFSAGAVVAYGSLVMILFYGVGCLDFSFEDVFVFCFAILFAIFLNIKSVLYFIKKILPIRIFLCSATGEILFLQND